MRGAVRAIRGIVLAGALTATVVACGGGHPSATKPVKHFQAALLAGNGKVACTDIDPDLERRVSSTSETCELWILSLAPGLRGSLAKAFRSPPRVDGDTAFVDVAGKVSATFDLRWGAGRWQIHDISGLTTSSHPTGSVPSNGNGLSNRVRSCRDEARRLKTAIEAFFANELDSDKQGTYPARMRDLVGGYLGQAPLDIAVTFNGRRQAPTLAWIPDGPLRCNPVLNPDLGRTP